MNPYAAPGSEPHAVAVADAERDIAESSPPVLARVAGGVVGLAGLVVALTGAQTMMMVRVHGLLAAAPWALIGLGLVEAGLAALVFRARAWGVGVAIGVSFTLVLSSSAWLLVSVGSGLLSLYALAGPAVSLAAAVLSLLVMGPSQRASAARARLKEQGMDLGI